MNTPHTPHDLDTALRQGARARRALLDEQHYPVGDYPPRPHHRPRNTTADNSLFRGQFRGQFRGRGFGAVLRGAWMLVLSGGITAVLLLGLAGVLQFMAPPETGPVITADTPQPETLSESVGTLVTQIQKAEQTLGRQLDPTFRLATAWPGHVQAFSESLGQPTTLPAPVEQELAAIRHDLLAAADYVRQQWRAPTSGSTAPGTPENPSNPGDSGSPTGYFSRPVDWALGTAAG